MKEKIFILLLVIITAGCSVKSIVIIDMPVLRENLPVGTQNQMVGIYNIVTPKKTFSDCKVVSEEIEKYFNFNLKKEFEKIKHLKHVDKFEGFANFYHGYHVLNTVAKGNTAKIHFIGLKPAITTKDLKNLQYYLDVELEEEFNYISKYLFKVKPDFVNLSGSESIDINESFFLQNNMSKEKALKNAQIIFNKWNDFWMKTIKALPKTTFVVSAGNGESDWKGDELVKGSSVKTQTTPAAIGLANIIVVGSKNKKGTSSFSNFGTLVKAQEFGEAVSAKIPCKNKSDLKLTGSSQATAIHTGKLL
jgi:hypothetical protein